jgi:hypothetical protein
MAHILDSLEFTFDETHLYFISADKFHNLTNSSWLILGHSNFEVLSLNLCPGQPEFDTI